MSPSLQSETGPVPATAAFVPQSPTGRRAAVLAFAPGVLLLAAMTVGGWISVGPAVALGLMLCAGCGWLTRYYGSRARIIDEQPSPVRANAIPQDFLDRLPDPIIVLNSLREIVAVNRPARDGLGIRLLGHDLALSLRHPDILAAFESIIAGAPSVTHEVTLPIPAARTFTLFASSLPSRGDHHASRVVLVLRDETRAKRAEQSRADFVANASHELRSPLTALIGLIETLRGPASDDAEARERFLGIMQTEARRMARLVEDLLSLSRVEMDEHLPPRDRVDLRVLLVAVADAMSVSAEQRRMAIRLDLPDSLPEVVGDMDQLAQVFHNLVGNSIKYGREGSAIQIVARAHERLPALQIAGLSIVVADEGDGIEAIHLPRLTERFYRVDKGRSRRLGGTGLGLAIVKHIANRHRGRLIIESTPGKGTTVTVLIPTGSASSSPAVDLMQSAAGQPAPTVVTEV